MMKLPPFLLAALLSISATTSISAVVHDNEKDATDINEKQAIVAESFRKFKLSSFASSHSEPVGRRRLGKSKKCSAALNELGDLSDIFMGYLDTDYYDNDICDVELEGDDTVATCTFSGNEFTECATDLSRVNLELVCEGFTQNYIEIGACGVPGCLVSNFVPYIELVLQNFLDENSAVDCTISVQLPVVPKSTKTPKKSTKAPKKSTKTPTKSTKTPKRK